MPNFSNGNNTAIGFTALRFSGASDYGPANDNIALGYSAGSNLTVGNNNIFIGHPGFGSPGQINFEYNIIHIGQYQTATASLG